MSQGEELIGDSSAHSALEPAPGGGVFRHRLTIRFTNGEGMSYTVREPLHAEDISPEHRFAVITTYLCDDPANCSEFLLLNLNDVSFIKTEHITESEIAGEAALQRLYIDQPEQGPEQISRIGFI